MNGFEVHQDGLAEVYPSSGLMDGARLVIASYGDTEVGLPAFPQTQAHLCTLRFRWESELSRLLPHHNQSLRTEIKGKAPR